MTENFSLAQEKKIIAGQTVEFFKMNQRDYSKMKRKMVAEMAKINDLQSAELVTVVLMDTPFFDLIQEIVYPIIRVNGKNISEPVNYETVMESAPDNFEGKLYHEILEVYMGKFIAALTTSASGSETTETAPEIPIRQIGKTGSSGNQY